jgi:hypothetical protein
MNKIIDYKVVEATYPSGLAEKVNKLIAEGWQPIGSHYVANSKVQNRFRGDQHIDSITSSEYTQTMVKYDNQ